MQPTSPLWLKVLPCARSEPPSSNHPPPGHGRGIRGKGEATTMPNHWLRAACFFLIASSLYGCSTPAAPALSPDPSPSITTTPAMTAPAPQVQAPILVQTATPEGNPMTAMPIAGSPSALLAGMSLEEKIGQTMIIGFDGLSVSPDLREMIVDRHIGGGILFARNVQSPQQGADLCAELQKNALDSGQPGLVIALEQEMALFQPSARRRQGARSCLWCRAQRE
ncbi:hypothetical protein FDZ74_17735, partial [bacterium]